MATQWLTSIDMTKHEIANLRLHMLPSDPEAASAAAEGLIYFNTTADEIRYCREDGGGGYEWIALGSAGSGAPPAGPAGGDLTGSYPNPGIATGVIVDADVSVSADIQQSKILGLTGALADRALAVTDLAAGDGLTGGGDLTTSRTFNVGAGTGITVAADSVSVDVSYLDSSYQLLSGKGQPNGYAPLDAASHIPTAHLPPLAINDVFTVANESEMLALVAQRGDMAIRTDTGQTFVLSTDDPTQLADWKEVMATGQVLSVNGQTGVVVLDFSDLGATPETRTIAAGAGLTGGGDLTANRTLDVGAGTGITVAADSVSVNRTVTDTWYSDSGHTHPPSSLKYTANVGDGTSTAITLSHNFGTRAVTVELFRNGTPWDSVFATVERPDANNVTLRFGVAPAVDEYTAVIFG